MPNVKLTINQPEGVPESVTLTALSRSDGQTLVIDPPLPQAMEAGDGGVWTYPFWDPSPWPPNGWPYAYHVVFSNGQTLDDTGVLPVITAKGRYGGYQDWLNIWEGINIQVWFDKDGNGQLLNSSLQAAMNYADSYVDLICDETYVTPLVFNSGIVHPVVQFCWSWFGVGQFGYLARGLSDSDKQGNKFSRMVADAKAELKSYCARNPSSLLPCQLKSGVSFGVTCVNPQRARNAWPPTPQRLWTGF